MKLLFTLGCLCTLFLQKISAQNIGIGITTPDASAMLDINSTSKGVLLPRMTGAQRVSISAPARGLMVFDNNTNTFWFYNGTSWINMAATGGFVMPYSQTMSTASTMLDVSNTGTGIGIKAASASNHGILGTTSSASSAGVRGDASGTNSAGVRGSSGSATGVGVDAINNAGGLALNVAGNLKISGGSTNPGTGKILTSDAGGGASWKANRVAFRATGTKGDGKATFPDGKWGRLFLLNKDYDFVFTFNNADGGVDESSFTAPVAGIYHFNAQVKFEQIFVNGGSTDFTGAFMRIMIKRNGSSWMHSFFSNDIPNGEALSISIVANDDVRLAAGDKVWIEAYQTNADSKNMFVSENYYNTYFSGHLVFEE